MGKLLLTIIAVILAIWAIKLAIIALVLAGLIFRTKETLGVLLLGGTVSLLTAYPLVGVGLVALFVAAAIVKAAKGGKQQGEPAALIEAAPPADP